MGINNLVQSVEITISGPFGTFLSYLYLFIIGSFIGWIGEVIFRRFFSMKRWINPGFLKGPCLPLYGFGVCILHFFTTIFLYFLNDSITLPSYYSNFIEPKGTLPFYLTSLKWVLPPDERKQCGGTRQGHAKSSDKQTNGIQHVERETHPARVWAQHTGDGAARDDNRGPG